MLETFTITDILLGFFNSETSTSTTAVIVQAIVRNAVGQAYLAIQSSTSVNIKIIDSIADSLNAKMPRYYSWKRL